MLDTPEDYCIVVNTYKPESPDEAVTAVIKNRIVVFEPHMPVVLPKHDAANLVTRLQTLIAMTKEQYFAKYGNQNEPKILILRSQGIGDILMLEPVIRQLHKQMGFKVDMGIRPDLKWVMQNCPDVGKIIDWHVTGDGEKFDPRDYNNVVDMNYYSERSALRTKLHRTMVYADKFNIGIPEDEREPRLYLDDGARKAGKKLLPKKGYIGIQLLASHSVRQYDRIGEVAMRLAEAGEKVALFCHDPFLPDLAHPNITDLQGKTDLQALCGCLDRCKSVIAADSGLMHIALALGVPTVCIFGAISPKFRITYYKAATEVMFKSKEDCPCRGCADQHVGDHCPHRGKPNYKKCTDFAVGEVVDAVLRLPKRKIKALVAAPRPTEEPGQAPAPPRAAAKPTAAPQAPQVRPQKPPAASKPRSAKLYLPFMFQDEPEEMMARFLKKVVGNKAISRAIAVDGGCKDAKIRKMLKAHPKVEYVKAKYDRTYFNMQAHQRNFSFSFVPDQTAAIYMDPDEEFSEYLGEWLPFATATDFRMGMIARATWDTIAEAKAASFKPPGKYVWPDWQPRLYVPWLKEYKFHHAAHHHTLNVPGPTQVGEDKHILHFHGEHGLREQREKQWAGMMKENDRRKVG